MVAVLSQRAFTDIAGLAVIYAHELFYIQALTI